MKIDFYKPRNALLNPYMEGYYFISDDKNEHLLQYYTYPNNYGILSVSKHSNLQTEKTQIIISHDPTTRISCHYINRYTKPIRIRYEHAISEVTIYFKPTGIHHFAIDFAELKHNPNNALNLFSDFESAMLDVLTINDRTQQILELERYWLSKLNPLNSLLQLENIIRDLENGDKIEQLSTKYKISRQYITKLFLKYVGKPPAEYRKIHRFRNALANYKSVNNLTEIAYDSLFFDQAHFNKDFKHLTNTNPSYFFNHVDLEKNMIWFYI